MPYKSNVPALSSCTRSNWADSPYFNNAIIKKNKITNHPTQIVPARWIVLFMICTRLVDQVLILLVVTWLWWFAVCLGHCICSILCKPFYHRFGSWRLWLVDCRKVHISCYSPVKAHIQSAIIKQMKPPTIHNSVISCSDIPLSPLSEKNHLNSLLFVSIYSFQDFWFFIKDPY